MQRIMIVEDNADLRTKLTERVRGIGYEPIPVTDFERILELFIEEKPDLVLLDVDLPFFDGYYWCRQIRAYSQCPVIYLNGDEGSRTNHETAQKRENSDTLVQPFSTEILTTALRDQLTKAYGSKNEHEKLIQFKGLKLFAKRSELYFDNRSEKLSKNEAALLEILITRGEQVTSRASLIDSIQENGIEIDDHMLNVYIRRVRHRLTSLGVSNMLERVERVGYRMKRQ
ncbi:response regulator transcription factor [Jeotgalibacillus soli]|uniref:OmpR/PhoB-type domain-containing protein n=1 Tax=Jeotgalibacillus soli TaxID=889306 RepID=A0A0C2VYW1_9BACL|nr:response regulator transcription factor [Jeotgalibacillus soli]KIL49576.1 hypothetical protein KP78_10440 [Jeotgalibacillus soli]